MGTLINRVVHLFCRGVQEPSAAEAGNALSSCLLLMTLDTQMTLALLQELLMALRANDADGYKSWLAIGIEELGREVAGEVIQRTLLC